MAVLRAVGVAIALAALWVTAWGVVDRLVPLHSLVRLLLLGILLLVVGAILLRPVRVILRGGIDWVEAARQVERRDPRFGEALATVVSHALSPAAGRASPQLVDRLTGQVLEKLDHPRRTARRLVRFKPAAVSLVSAAVAMFILFDLCLWPWLGMRQLLARQLNPLGSARPVTTTHIEMLTAAAQVAPGRPVNIIARATPPEPSFPILRCTIDGRTWSSIPMSASPDGLLMTTLPSVTRDMRYQVVAGDGISDVYEVKVLRPPIVRELRMRLTYPEYVGRDALAVTSHSGDIEAPVGTHASIAVVSSEPLANAWLIIDHTRVETHATSDPHVRRAQIDITRDGRYTVELLSERGVSGTSANEAALRAIPDRAPIARVLLSDSTWLMRPDDTFAAPYQSADDYALSAMEAVVAVNQAPPVRIPLTIGADARRCQGTLKLDLRTLRVAHGDVVTVTLSATDRTGNSKQSSAQRIIVSSQTISVQQRQRASGMEAAARLAARTVRELGSVDATDGRGAAVGIAIACESTAAIVPALLTPMAELDDRHASTLLGSLIDAAGVQARRLEQLGADAHVLSTDALGARVAAARANASALRQHLDTQWQGLGAEIILAWRTALRELPHRADEIVPQLSHHAAELGLDPQQDGLEQLLRARIESARQLAQSAQPIDFVRAAQQWATARAPAEHLLAERLMLASQALAALGRADAQQVRDLQAASRAARNIDNARAAAAADARYAYAAALASLLDARGADNATVDRARQAMRRWAGEPDGAGAAQVARARPASGAGEPSRRPDADAPESREPALAAIRRAHEAMARMPELLDRTAQAAEWLRRSRQLLQQAQAALHTAAPAQQPADRRAVAAAQVQLAEASRVLSDISRSLDPDYTWTMARELEAFAPQTLAAVAPLEQDLAPALEALHTAVESADPDNTVLASDEARYAIALVQDGLRESRRALLERDPLVAARWFAQQTATTQPEHRPATAPALFTQRHPENPANRAVGGPADDTGAADVETELPGFEQALRLYFELIDDLDGE
jgi:hypothetical protein